MWSCQRLLAGRSSRCSSWSLLAMEGYSSILLGKCPGLMRTTICLLKNLPFCSSAHQLNWLKKRAVYEMRFNPTKNKLQSSEQSKTFVHVFRSWGVLTILLTTFVSTSVVWWELWLLEHNLSEVTAAFTGTKRTSSHLYQSQHLSQKPAWKSNTGLWFPWIQSKSHDPFKLLELCRSDNPTIRRFGVEALASRSMWEDYQCRYIAQAADYKTLIGLSRSQGADPRFFLPQPTLTNTKTPVAEELASLLLALDHHLMNNITDESQGWTANNTATLLAHQHVQRRYKATDDKSQFWGFDGSSLDVASLDSPPPEEHLLLQFLTAVSQLCCTAEQASMFVKRKGLAILQRITEQYENTMIFTAVATVLGNLAIHSAVHEMIVRTGWLGILKSWSEGKNSMLAVMAARVLANLDQEWTGELLDDGILILHPMYRSRKTVHADVVFVHGLLGGGVKTWRQHDSIACSGQPYTDCWPKDWLAEDCPHIRIISIHYDTAISIWSENSTANKHKCTLEGRSKELLYKLKKAGVGTRPVIWVGHSMGGLLIKQMLDLADAGPSSSVKQQTCGFLLYSVPHRGLSIAALSHYLLYPSTEVQELSSESAHLLQLHKNFQQFVETNSIPCLSFGEERKTQFRKTLPRLHLVPPESSDAGVGEFDLLPLDHIGICKPESRDGPLYQRSLAFLHHAIFFSYVHRIRQAVTGSLD